MTRKQEILRGIEGHGNLQAEIGEAILEHGNNLCQHDFDRILGRWDRLRHMSSITGDTYLLSIGGPQQEALHLAHLMIEAGLITADRRDDGLVYYSIPD